MSAPRTSKGATQYLDLINFLQSTRSTLSPEQATELAVDAWLVHQRNLVFRHRHAEIDAPLDESDTVPPTFRPRHTGTQKNTADDARGYHWKCLFLPDGTDLCMQYDGRSFHARVVGDAILFNGHAVSPRQMTLAIAGDGRNAWRDLSLRYPGEKRWKFAYMRRAELRHAGDPKVLTTAESMVAAAACMADALKTALSLVEHSNAAAQMNEERRADRHRRKADEEAAICMGDG